MAWYKFLKSLFGTKTADRMTNYQYWTVPPAENVDPPRILDKVQPGASITLPDFQKDQLVDAHRGKPQDDGVMTGRPMQWGTTTMRSISWGYLKYGQKNFAKLPAPKSGWYWKTGHPVPMYDRHCIVRFPDATKKVFHETIQLDETVDPNSNLTNNALGWGRFEDGVLVSGRETTATDNVAHVYVWTPWSKENPHRMSITVTNYDGADGDLEGIGIKAGSLVTLPVTSQSYQQMVALGGECEVIAKALATYGAVVIDRGGSNGFAVQPGSQWQTTNIAKFQVKLSDFVYAA
jgi:hypothetical protein